MTSVLQISGIEKSFVGFKVLHGVSMDVRRGEIHALLGENGAGKSTLMKILCGAFRPDTGSITIDGEERHFRGFSDAVAAGVGIVFQEFSLIPHLNAVENIFLGREITNPLGLLNRRAMIKRAREILARLSVDIDLNAKVSTLSVAQQQFVEIAKALSLDAKILILDEPTATLTPNEVEHLFVVMRELRRQGVAMIFISHHLDEIFEICDRITVLRDGHYVGTTDVAATNIDNLVEMMVGRRIENSFPPKPPASQFTDIVLDVEALQDQKDGPVNSFQLRKGEILGFAGLVGSGRTETALGVLGERRTYQKKMRVNGVEKTFVSAADALNSGIGLLPESRKTEGLIVSFSCKQNISINNYPKYAAGRFFIDRKRETKATIEAMRRVTVKARGPEIVVGTLSGGNQQKVVLARWINHHANILFFDEPTRGIDVGAKAEIYSIMRTLTESGYSIVMISSELPEVIGMCDRVCVFKSGRIVKTLAPPQITPEEIMKFATAGDSHVNQ
jgi:ribose transport system ATP-binding protein